MMAEPLREHLDTLTWLEQLYGTAEDGWLTLFSLDRSTGERGVDWSPVADLCQLATAAEKREPHGCVWFGVATRSAKLSDNRRGGDRDCVAIPGLWVDIDIKGPGHKADHRLARDRAHAHELVDAFPLPPTAVIDSGGGLQAWWLFSELIELDDRTRELLAAWGTTWTQLADDLDMDLDNVFEAARVMRLPGTTNRKEGLARPVELVAGEWVCRYGLDDIEGHLSPAPPQPEHKVGGPHVPYIGPQRPGDAFNARHSAGEVLARAGFTLARTDRRSGEEHWCRPGKEARDGTSATVYPDDGHVTIWSDTCAAQWPGLDVRRPYDPFGLYVVIEHRNDWSAATRHLRSMNYGSEMVMVEEVAPSALLDGVELASGDWDPIDLTEIIDGDHQPPQPTILDVAGLPLFYEGRVNAVFGESGAGKTWVALAALAEVIRSGGCGILMDLEDTPQGVVARLKGLGLTGAQINAGLIYLAPQTAWGPAGAAAMARVIAERRPSIAVLDSTGEALAAAGVKGNDDDDVARWFVVFPKYIARLGPAVIVIDHVPKDENAPSTFQIGSQRKKAAIDGGSYRVNAVKPPSKTTDGMLKVITAKDRHGNRSQGSVAAMVAITHPMTGGVQITLSAPGDAPVNEEGEFRPTHIMEQISRLLADEPGRSGKDIESRIKGKAATIREATRLLLVEGFIAQDPTRRGFAYLNKRPFSADVSELSIAPPRDLVPPRPTSSFHIGDDPRPSSPSPTGDEDGSSPKNGATSSPPRDEVSGPSGEPTESGHLGADSILAGLELHDPWDLGLGGDEA